MARAKPTSGPLHVVAIDGVTLGIDDKFGADGGRDYFLATVKHGDPDTLRANAAIFAAAPRMLKALRAAYALIDSVAFVSQPGDAAPVLRQLRTAIEAAQGGK